MKLNGSNIINNAILDAVETMVDAKLNARETTTCNIEKATKEKIGMNFKQILPLLISGHKIKRQPWEGYWIYNSQDKKVMMHCRDGQIINIPDAEDVLFTLSNIAMDDWEVVE